MTAPEQLPAPESPEKLRSQRWREVLRILLLIVVTMATLTPLIWYAIKDDVTPDSWFAEFWAQALIVAGALTKVMQIPLVDAWLTSIGIGRVQAGLPPTSKTHPKLDPPKTQPIKTVPPAA